MHLTRPSLATQMNGTLLGLLIPTVADEFSVSTELAAWISIGSQFTSAMLGTPSACWRTPSAGRLPGGSSAPSA